MCFKMGSWHTLSLCGSAMLPEVLASTALLPSWLQLDWVADGGTIGVVGQWRSCLGEKWWPHFWQECALGNCILYCNGT